MICKMKAPERELLFSEYLPQWQHPPLSPDTPIAVVVSRFAESVRQSGTGENTASAFEADMNLFVQALGGSFPAGQLGAAELRRFYHYLTRERDIPCSPRSLRRRHTTLSAFFRFLQEEQILEHVPDTHPDVEPVTPLRKHPAVPLLTDAEIRRLYEEARRLLIEGNSRPLLLFSLLLSTGMSKNECLALRVENFDLEGNQLQLGEGDTSRTVPLSAESREALLAYLSEETSKHTTVFDCTGRNLEYVLADLGQRAGLSQNPSFRILRFAAAKRMLDSQLDTETIVQTLGISPHTWPAMRRRIIKAERHLE